MTAEYLTPAQQAVKDLTDSALAEKRSPQLTFVDFEIREDPAQVEQRLQGCAVGDVLLGAGDSFSANYASGHYPDLHLIVGEARLTGVYLRVYGWEYPKRRIDPKGPTTPPHHVIEFPDEFDWTREIEITLAYSNGTESAYQVLSIQTSSLDPGEVPTVSRHVEAPCYAETGYEGHNRAIRRGTTDREVLEVVQVAKELFEHRLSPLGIGGVA